MTGTDLTILVALAAGVISFLSPCVLPLVPAYLGQMTAIAVAASATGARAISLDRDAPRARLRRRVRCRVHVARRDGDVRRRTARRVPPGPSHGRWRRPHRHGPEPRGHPPHPGPRAELATARCRRVDLACDRDRHVQLRRFGNGRRRARSATASAAALVSSRGGWLASFGLGAIFAIGWTPCIGIILGSILTMAASTGTVLQGTACSSPTPSVSGCLSC